LHTFNFGVVGFTGINGVCWLLAVRWPPISSWVVHSSEMVIAHNYFCTTVLILFQWIAVLP